MIAEIETDKATMEVEAVDEGVLGKILVADGTEGVKVNEPIAVLVEQGEAVPAAPPATVRSPRRPQRRPAARAPATRQQPRPAGARGQSASRAASDGPGTGQQRTRLRPASASSRLRWPAAWRSRPGSTCRR